MMELIPKLKSVCYFLLIVLAEIYFIFGARLI